MSIRPDIGGLAPRALSPPPSEVWARLRGDRTIVLGAVALVLLGAPLLFPFLEREARATYAESYLDIPLLLLVAAAFLQGVRGVDHPERRRFKWYTGWAMVLWAFNIAFTVVAWEASLTRAGALLNDAIYLAFYLLFALAIELRPDRAAGWTRRNPIHRMRVISTAVLALTVVTYFVVIPSTLAVEAYDSWLPSVLMYIALDLYLLLRLVNVRWACRARAFKTVYGLLGLAVLCFLGSDLVEYLILAGRMELPGGSALDLAWLAPYPLLLLAARWPQLFPPEAEAGSIREHSFVGTLRAVALQAVLAFLIPVVHLSMYGAGLLDPATEWIRSLVIIASLLALGGLVLVQQAILEKRNRRLQREVAESQEHLQHSQRMEAVGRLAGGIAHDFNNLLTVVGGCSELALEKLAPEEAARRDIEAIHQAGQKAAGLTQQLLAFSRKQIMQPRILDLNSTILDFQGLLRRTLGEDVALELNLEESLPSIRADPSQMEQVLMNLSVNARTAMPSGGTLTIETQSLKLDKGMVWDHAEVDRGSYAVVTVSDTGAGMDEETRRRAFEPFFSTRPEEQGSGLGLAVVYGIVKQSLGHIWVHSEPGRGTTFEVCFPTAASGSGDGEPAADGPDRSRGGHETVLVVEDDPAVRDLAARALCNRGYRVLTASRPAEARRLLARQKERLDLLITDVVMPGGTGPELGRWLAARQPDTAVLYISGYPAGAVQGQQSEVGPNFLAKPFGAARLAAEVRRILDDRSTRGPGRTVLGLAADG